MASRRAQIITVSIIWVSVCGLGWHAYKNVLPKYGFFAQARGNRGGNREEWRKAQEEQQAFYKENVPSKVWIKVSEAKPETRVRMGGGIHREQTNVFYYARGATMSEAYASLSGTPRWRVSQLPREAQRWDIRIKAPAAQRDQLAQAFLSYMKWDVKKRKTQVDGYTLTSGTPPAPPPASPAEGQGGRRGGREFPRMPLGRMAGMLSGRANAPVSVDEAVREKQPPGEGNIPLPWNLRGAELMTHVAALYGVAVSKQPVELETHLVYHPKFTSSFEVGRWEKEGGQDPE